MMLISIKKLKGLGVFGNYAAANDLATFGRYNIIYGENGSGKTTLSRLFALLDRGEHPDHPELDYSISTDSGSVSAGQSMARKVRVFNAEYVEEHLGRFDGPVRPILIVGKENRALAAEVVAERGAYYRRVDGITAAQKSQEKLTTDKGKIFSAIAKTIGEATSGGTLRQYRKPDAETAFAKLTAPSLLSEDDLEANRATVHQEQLEYVPALELPIISKEMQAVVHALLARTAQSGALASLARNPELSAWVEQGLGIHRHLGTETCAFCEQSMPAGRIDLIAQHFGIEDQRLKADIETAISTIDQFASSLEKLQPAASSALYSELRTSYAGRIDEFEAARSTVLVELAGINSALSEKLLNRSVASDATIVLDLTHLASAVAQLNAILSSHNDKTKSFDAAKAAARSAVEGHYLSSVWDQVKEFDRLIVEQQAIARGLNDGTLDETDSRTLSDLKASFENKQARVSSAHVGGAELTEKLQAFLGRSDLQLESAQDGYRVLRRGQAAKRLSEGEKTAIAFLHFVVRLGDQDFDLNEGIVVIDDPVSSLDSSAMYQAFGFLKNAVKDAKQVFLLTHNFEFLQLLINWLKNMKKNVKRGYFMVVCKEEVGGRSASIIPLDKLLLDHTTEYHYLFKLLYGFKSDGTILAAYHIPNVARKVLETFLEFNVPSEGSLYQRIEAIDFDAQKKTAIYKFANDLSHATGKGFDPALVSEAQKNVTALLEMIKAVAPAHYAGLEILCGGIGTVVAVEENTGPAIDQSKEEGAA